MNNVSSTNMTEVEPTMEKELMRLCQKYSYESFKVPDQECIKLSIKSPAQKRKSHQPALNYQQPKCQSPKYQSTIPLYPPSCSPHAHSPSVNHWNYSTANLLAPQSQQMTTCHPHPIVHQSPHPSPDDGVCNPSMIEPQPDKVEDTKCPSICSDLHTCAFNLETQYRNITEHMIKSQHAIKALENAAAIKRTQWEKVQTQLQEKVKLENRYKKEWATRMNDAMQAVEAANREHESATLKYQQTGAALTQAEEMLQNLYKERPVGIPV